jgi:deoxyribonuclease V
VAGVDVGFEDNGRTARGAIAILSFPDLELIASQVSRRTVEFPYIPGYLSFREVPVLLDAIRLLDALPDLILCDGQGLAHPRRFGMACHLGVLTGIPTIGVAKTRLIGHFIEPAENKGSWSPLTDGDETIGAAVRTRAAKKPVFVSLGHTIGLRDAIKWVLACCSRYRLPETTRAAHRIASMKYPANGA